MFFSSFTVNRVLQILIFYKSYIHIYLNNIITTISKHKYNTKQFTKKKKKKTNNHTQNKHKYNT